MLIEIAFSNDDDAEVVKYSVDSVCREIRGSGRGEWADCGWLPGDRTLKIVSPNGIPQTLKFLRRVFYRIDGTEVILIKRGASKEWLTTPATLRPMLDHARHLSQGTGIAGVERVIVDPTAQGER